MPRLPRLFPLLRFGLACLATLLLASRAQAVTVQVIPADTTVTTGDTLVVRVVTDAFPDLKAYELLYHYDARLQYLGRAAGDVLTASGSPYTVNDLPDTAAPADTAGVDCAQLLTSTSGPGILIYFKFKAIATGTAPIDCLEVDFRDSFNNQTLPACVGGVVHITGPVPVRRSTWGAVKTMYR